MGCRLRTKHECVRFCLASAATQGEKEAPFVATAAKGASASMKTRQLAIDAVLSAMCAVLGTVAIDLNSIKITLESFPVLLGALLFGPIDGMVIGFVGTLLYQLLRYGVSVTTLLWILPYAVTGFLAGWFAKKHSFRLSSRQTIGIVTIAEILVTALNTGVMYLDSRIYGYWFRGFISAMLIPRTAVCIIKATAFGLILPKVIEIVKKAAPGRKDAGV